MFDSIKLWMPQERAGSSDMLAQAPVHLDELKPIDKGSLTHYSGKMNNLYVYVAENGVFIRGSLPKYYLGDNIQNFTRSDTEQAISQLSDEFHLPIERADVKGIDFAYNFIMNHKPKVYFNYLGECQYFDRLLQPETLYYQNNSRSKLFYDKLLEANPKPHEIPQQLRGSNLLRFEVRYRERLCSRLNEPEITANRLYEEQFYIKLVDRYVSEYQSIHKNAEIKLNTDKMDSPKDFWRQIALMKIDEIGINKMMQMIDEWRAKDVFNDPAYYSRLKKEIRDYSKEYEPDDATPLIEELNKKVSRVKIHYR